MDESSESDYGLPYPTKKKDECLGLGASPGSREQRGEMENAFDNSNSYDQAIVKFLLLKLDVVSK